MSIERVDLEALGRDVMYSDLHPHFVDRVMQALTEVRRLRAILQHIDAYMGPTVPPCCSGCEAEWSEVLKVLYAELGESSYTARARRKDAEAAIEGTVTDPATAAASQLATAHTEAVAHPTAHISTEGDT